MMDGQNLLTIIEVDLALMVLVDDCMLVFLSLFVLRSNLCLCIFSRVDGSLRRIQNGTALKVPCVLRNTL